MEVRVGCDFTYETDGPTPAVMQVYPYVSDDQLVLRSTREVAPEVPVGEFTDVYGNICWRFVMPGGRCTVHFDAVVDVSGELDHVYPDARQMPVQDLPDDALQFTLPSRYCLPEVLAGDEWQLFSSVESGWRRVQAVCDWVHTNIRFQYGTSTPYTTSADVFETRVGVCRDYAHLAISFCRALNIPARYVFGYLPDIGVTASHAVMDFCAWFEVYLEGGWYTFDPRNNQRRVGRVVIGKGRDALDVAMATTYGQHRLLNMTVLAERVGSAANPENEVQHCNA